MAVRNYRELFAWQKAMDLVVAVYEASRVFPKEETYMLTGQLRRAAVSIPSNIAEGQGRGVGREFTHHLRIAYGSLRETETQLLIAERLGYLPARKIETILELSSEVGRLINGLMKSLNRQE
jgi:four helix bundle protein